MYPGTHAASTPDKPAVIQAESGRVVTYRELDEQSTQLARLLRAAGLQRGDRLAVLMDNDARYLTVCWAAQRSGLVYVPVNWHLTGPEAAYIVENCEAKALVVNAGVGELAREVRRSVPSLAVELAVDGGVDGFGDFDLAIAAFPTDPLDDELEGADMIYSSGTTGRPKGGKRPMPDFHPSTLPRMMLDGFYGLFGLDESSVYLSPGAPLYHGAPGRFSMAVTRYGGTNVIMQRFDPDEALAVIERYKVTHSQWVPTMFTRLLRLPDDVRQRYDLSSHEVAIHAAAPCSIALKEQMIEWWGPILQEYYGGSEGGVVTYADAEQWLQHRGTVGKPIAGVLHIVDDDGNELPPGQVGVVYSERGVPVEYFNEPEKTKNAHNAKGWVTIGDMGYVDADGYLYLTDRKDHMIISGGVNIYPQEAEAVLAAHPKVADVAVIGVPNEEFGEEVKAVVELVDPSEASDDLAAELIEYCKSQLSGYKCPRSVDFERELPRAPSGKLYKRRVRERYWAGHASQVV